MVAPCALLMKRGVPPTPRNARTGELTPPGISSTARANNAADLSCASVLCAVISVVLNRLKVLTQYKADTCAGHARSSARKACYDPLKQDNIPPPRVV